MSSRASGRGQLFSMDAVFAMIVFASLFGVLLIFNSDISSTINSVGLRANIQEDAQAALLALVATPGEPSNWTLYNLSLPESDGVRSVGVAAAPWTIDSAKLYRLASINQTNLSFLKSALGLSKPDYNFYFYLTYNNGTQLAVAGSPRVAGNRTSTIATDYVVKDGQAAQASLMVWVSEYV
jgi:hypothetical protein